MEQNYELIPITENEHDEQIVSGRMLHAFLGVKTEYSHWIERRIDYCFTDGLDFSPILTESTGGRPSIDHALKLDMAKELCMLEKNEIGKQARRYFIQVEKDWNSPDKVMARALKLADKTIGCLRLDNASLSQTIVTQQPKVLFADSVAASNQSILVGEMAKLLKQNGVSDIGQNRFFEWLRENGYLIRRKGTDYNMPTQYSMELALFEIKETTITHADGHISISKTPKVTGKGQIYFVSKFRSGKG